MTPYPKIQSVYKRDPDNNFKTFLDEYSTPEIEYLADNLWLFKEKIDGTNIRVIWNGCDTGADAPSWIIKGRTDKAQVQPALTEAIEVMFNSPVVLRYINENFLDAPLCFYGEGYGGNIQKAGPGYRKDPSFICFDVKVGEIWLKAKDVQDLCGAIDVPFVPTLGYGPLSSAETMCREGFQSLVPGSDVMAEGVIAIPEAELLDRNGRRIITKLKRKDFAQCK